MEPMSDDHATDRPRAAADAEPGAPAEPGPAVAHPVDWAFAARTARSLAAAGPRFTPREATREAEGLRAAAEAAVPHVHRLTGLEAARDLRDSQVLVVDRPTWSRAATQSFATLLDPTFAHLRDTRPREHAAATTRVTRHATALEMGGILAWMSGRILGQYDPFIALPGPGGTAAGPAGGRLLLVAPNVAQVRAEINVDPADFRLWVCLHEEAHRVQFTAVPWLREHVVSAARDLLVDMAPTPEEMATRVGEIAKRVPEAFKEGSMGLSDIFATPEQRTRMADLAAVMSLLEGHADVVMDDVGPQIVPSVETIRARFGDRRAGLGNIDKLLRRLMGLEAKMRQYRDGAAFVRGVQEKVGIDGFNAVWAAPENLPTPAEIQRPQLWVERIHGSLFR